MVFINSQKFACESCIKGHRSSSCTHTERPLYEIKKKGRPVSQCERCRQLRNTKRVHSKCTCSDGSVSRSREVTDKVFGTKQKRYIPIVPALPNGLKDALTSSNTTPVAPAHPLQKVASLLNPCQCNDVWNCGCKTPTATEAPCSSSIFVSETQTPSPSGNNSASAPASCGGLETLARAAAAILISSPLNRQTPLIRPQQQTIPSSGADEHASPGPTHASSKVTMLSAPILTLTPVLDLPPLVFPDVPGPTPVVPPFSTFTTLAGSGCSCGLTCQCPNCASHRPKPGVNPSESLDCMNCVDPSLDVIDRGTPGGFHIKSPVLEKFFADAERVPPPPTVGGKPVELPKLCCGGSCNCGGACGCSGDCNGCCESETLKNPRSDPISVSVNPSL